MLESAAMERSAVLAVVPDQPMPMAPVSPTTIIFEGTPSWKAWFWSYVGAGVLSLVLVGLLWIVYLNVHRKSLRYKVTERTIDYERGVFSRRIETLQLWRIRDIEFQQSLLERMLGIARIHVFTNDVTDSALIIKGLPASREIFDRLKEAVEISRQRRVVGLVE